MLVKLGKVLKWTAVAIPAAAVATVLAAYIQASRVPRHYAPATLSARQRDQAAKDFLNRKILDEFGNAAQFNEPFEWVITEDELNRYLASMDEIAASAPSVQPGELTRQMIRAGLTEPSVALRDGKVTVMARSSEYQKIISADLGFRLTPAGLLEVSLLEVRAGRLPLPDSAVRDRIGEVKAALTAGNSASDRSDLGGISSREVGQALRSILAAIDARPLTPELTWSLNDKRVRIAAIEIADGSLRLRFVPVRRR